MADNTFVWERTKYMAMIGDVEARISFVGTVMDRWNDRNPKVILFRIGESKDIKAIRWEVGCLIDLGTESWEQAKAGIEAMYAMEGLAHAP